MLHRVYNMIWQLHISVDKFEVVGVFDAPASAKRQ